MDDKIFISCERAKAPSVLEFLHNFHELAKPVFPTKALNVYFGQDRSDAVILNHPNPSAHHGTYASKLGSYATAANPQDEFTPPNRANQSMTQKRTRDGHQKAPNSTTTDTGLTAAARLADTTTNNAAFQKNDANTTN